MAISTFYIMLIFVSLGIMLVSIFVLVDHFKRKYTTIEHKNDQLYSALSDLRYEIQYIANMQESINLQKQSQQPIVHMTNMNNTTNNDNDNIDNIDNIDNNCNNYKCNIDDLIFVSNIPPIKYSSNIQLNDNESDNESDDESDNESDDESDDESDNESGDDNKLIVTKLPTSLKVTDDNLILDVLDNIHDNDNEIQVTDDNIILDVLDNSIQDNDNDNVLKEEVKQKDYTKCTIAELKQYISTIYPTIPLSKLKKEELILLLNPVTKK